MQSFMSFFNIMTGIVQIREHLPKLRPEFMTVTVTASVNGLGHGLGPGTRPRHTATAHGLGLGLIAI